MFACQKEEAQSPDDHKRKGRRQLSVAAGGTNLPFPCVVSHVGEVGRAAGVRGKGGPRGTDGSVGVQSR